MNKYLICCLSFVSSATIFSQNIGINGTGATPDNSAMLDVVSSDKGMLIPRMTTIQRTGIASPATGLEVYDTSTNTFWYFNGSVWVEEEIGDADWTISGVDMYSAVSGDVGIGIVAPTQKLDVQGGNARINNAFIGDVGHGAGWAGFTNSSTANTTDYGFLQNTDGSYTLINKANTGSGHIGFRQGNVDMAVIDYNGNMGIGTTTPATNARLQVVGGSIMPEAGNSTADGIYFPDNPGGGAGDEAYIRYYVESGENTKLVIANQNDADDDLDLQTGGQSRINIDGDGSVTIDEGVLFDCNDCGDVATIDGASNWGDLVIQGRVLSTNSNLHLSPPGGYRVIINSTYRAAGGGGGTTGLDIQDGGIRFRKDYYYFQRYVYCNCYGAGAATHTIGDYDFCSISHVGFKNNQSNTDEDDDVQCAVYPNGHGGSGEQTNYSTSFTYQYKAKPTWIMYLEAYQDTNGATCGAICINFD